MNAADINKAYDIIKNYTGENDSIKEYAKKYAKGQIVLGKFEVEYIIKNYNYKPIELNRIFSIASDFGERLQTKLNLEFLPKKLWIGKIIGEMGDSYHCFCQYRLSVMPNLMYVPKKAILNDIFVNDYKKIDIDFDYYDKICKIDGFKLREHQKEGIKFMVSNKKCINADSMGVGKSVQLIISALETKAERILVITTASLKTNFMEDLVKYVDKEDISIIYGSKWNEPKKFNIINYDIIDNFYEVAEEPVYEYHDVLDKNGNLVERLKVPVMTKTSCGKLVQKMQKSRKKEKIEESLSKSPLFKAKFDCVIIDEVHKLSNNKSNRYKTISDFLKKSNIEYVFLATGTPLTNRPINLYWILKLIDADITKDYRYFVKRYCGGHEIHLKDGRTVMTMKDATNLGELREKIKNIYIRRLPSEIGKMVNKTISRRYYNLNEAQKLEYEKLWGEYQASQEAEGKDNNEDYRQLVEGVLVRQYLAKEMVPNTIELVDDYIEQGEKVVIITTFKEEMEMFKKHYGKKCVTYDGEMTPKAKDKAKKSFLEDKNVQVFIGQIVACGVGLNLQVSKLLIFNSYSWSESDNRQAQDRVYRLNQTRDVECIYQLFTDSISQDMFDKVLYKGLIMDETIKSENNK